MIREKKKKKKEKTFWFSEEVFIPKDPFIHLTEVKRHFIKRPLYINFAIYSLSAEKKEATTTKDIGSN